MVFVRKKMSVLNNSEDDEIGGPNDDEPVEPVSLRLTTDESGRILKHTQIDNYYYHDSSLSQVNFFDFVQFYRVERQRSLHYAQNGNPQLGTFTNTHTVKPMRL